MAVQAECARRVVDSYQTLPLLDSEGFCGIDAEPHRLTLRVESVKINVCDNSKRCLSAVRLQLV